MRIKSLHILGVSLLLLCFGLKVTAQIETGARNSDFSIPKAEVACGPWLQAVTENEFVVVWTTNVDAAVWVELAPDDGSHFYAKTRPRFFESKHGRRLTGQLHRVKISGLQPGTKYRYRIYQQAVLLDQGNKRMVFGDSYGTDVLRSEPYSVTTLNEAKESINISMVNDIHGDDSLFRKLMGNIQSEQTDFIVFNGDMLTQIESEKQLVDGYLQSTSELFASDVPLFALRGNHELRGKFAHRFFDYFPSPNGKAYYAFRHGPAYFIFLDSGEDKPDSDVRYYGLSVFDDFREEQAQWLEQVLSSDEFKSAPVKIVFMHMPPAQRAWHGMMEVKRLFMPLLNEADVDLMLSGHIHKHSFIPSGEIGNSFPVLINSNDWRTDLTINRAEIAIRLVDSEGAVVNTYQLKTKQ